MSRSAAQRRVLTLSSVFQHRQAATPRAARDLRALFEQWLVDQDVPLTTAEDLGLAIYEALANVVEHAYSFDDPHPTMHIAARLTDHSISVTITDHGRWQPPSANSGHRGRGLSLIEQLTHTVRITPSPTGTAIQIEVLLTDAQPAHEWGPEA